MHFPRSLPPGTPPHHLAHLPSSSHSPLLSTHLQTTRSLLAAVQVHDKRASCTRPI
jgi:hypothetical protein